MTVKFLLGTLIELHRSLAQMLPCVLFHQGAKISVFETWGWDVKLKFNLFIASVEYSNTNDAGLSYDFCVFLKQMYLYLKFLKTSFCMSEMILEKSLDQ